MNFYRLDYTIEKVLEELPTTEQAFLKEYTGLNLSSREAAILWERIVNHKWYVSEKLNRDIGFRAAAVDFIENFYESGLLRNQRNNFKNSIRQLFKNIARTEFLRPKAI